jgi:glycosyltransferase involved in cell wall biosynthesis
VHKGIFELLKAYDRLSGTVPPLVVLGTPKSKMPKAWPKGSVVRYNVPHADVMAAWSHCGFGVIPSVWPEPFGLVALEAGVMSKAVVASDVGGLADIVKDGVNGLLVPPRDIPRLSRAMQRLLEDEDLRESLGAAGRERAVEFTIARMTDRLDAICEEVVAGRH